MEKEGEMGVEEEEIMLKRTRTKLVGMDIGKLIILLLVMPAEVSISSSSTYILDLLLENWRQHTGEEDVLIENFKSSPSSHTLLQQGQQEQEQLIIMRTTV